MFRSLKVPSLYEHRNLGETSAQLLLFSVWAARGLYSDVTIKRENAVLLEVEWFEESLNAYEPSEYPPDRRKTLKRLGEIIVRSDKNLFMAFSSSVSEWFLFSDFTAQRFGIAEYETSNR